MSGAGPAVPTGNTFDKYGSTNPLVRRLMTGFERALDDLFAVAAPASVLDVGCGEGVLTERWAARIAPGRIVGVDLEDPGLRAEWAARSEPANLEFRAMGAERLAFAQGEFELVTATEVLEHVPDPAAAVSEMARVARRWLLVSVPHEPLWRALNVGPRRLPGRAGQHPGSRQPLDRNGVRAPARRPRGGRGRPLAVPVDDAARPGRLMSSTTVAPDPPSGRDDGQGAGRDPDQRSFASGTRVLSIGIASTGIFTFAYLATASHVLSARDYGLVSLCWAVMFVILSVIYRPIEQLLSRTIADRRARGLHAHSLRVPALIQLRLRGRVPRARARAAPRDRARHAPRLGGALLDPRRRRDRVRGQLLRARVVGRAPVLRALRGTRVPGVDVTASCSHSRSRSGSARGWARSASGWRWRRSSHCR